MIIIITGSPLSGKTTLLKELQKNGVKVFSADTFVTNIYKAGEEGYELIKETLGEEFVTPESVNRRVLAEWATIDDNLTRLNELIHPLIFNYLEGKDNYVAELPILTNSPIKFKYDKLVLVKAKPETIVNRFEKTNLRNPAFIAKIIDDWNIDIPFDIEIDTTNNIKDKHIEEIKNFLK